MEVIEHLRDPATLLQEAHRILAPNGVLVVGTGNAPSWTVALMGGRWDYFQVEPFGGHVSFFTPRSISRLAERCGFRVERLETQRVRFVESHQAPKVVYRTLKILAEGLNVPARWLNRVREIYQLGIELGNNPQAFSKVGHCGSTPAWFLGDFDQNPKYYDLGEYTYLEPVIQEFQGSYERTSLAAKAGFNAAWVFSLIWSNREQCQPDETPLACEYRIQRPSFAFIMLGSNDVWHQDSFEPQMRQIIEYSLQHGVIPILSTKADNLEKDGSINFAIARLAQEYRVPLINYWRAVQSLPEQGLQDDAVHITC